MYSSFYNNTRCNTCCDCTCCDCSSCNTVTSDAKIYYYPNNSDYTGYPRCYTNPTVNNNNSSCQYQCPQPPTPTPVCPTITYITTIASSNSIVSGGGPIMQGTIIPAGSTTVPANTVVVINGYTGAPSTNQGGILPNNGFFTLPVAGRYFIGANICYGSVPVTTTADIRETFIYKVDGVSGVVSAIAVDSRIPIQGASTCVEVSTVENFSANDRVFIAVRQLSPISPVDTVPGNGRLSITRLC